MKQVWLINEAGAGASDCNLCRLKFIAVNAVADGSVAFRTLSQSDVASCRSQIVLVRDPRVSLANSHPQDRDSDGLSQRRPRVDGEPVDPNVASKVFHSTFFQLVELSVTGSGRKCELRIGQFGIGCSRHLGLQLLFASSLCLLTGTNRCRFDSVG